MVENMIDLKNPVKPDWEERVKNLCKPKHWHVSVYPYSILWLSLTEEEKIRMKKKIEMVEEGVGYLLAGMLKGTIKYEKDNISLAEWMAHLLDEGADQFNYIMLALNRWRQE